MASLDAIFRRLMFRRVPAAMADVEISMQEMKAIGLLSMRGRMIMSAFAEALDVPVSTATHTVDKLVAKGLVQRSRTEEDRRVVEVDLSETGKRHDRFVQEQRLAMARSMLGALSPRERKIYLGLVAKIARTVKLPNSEDTERKMS